MLKNLLIKNSYYRIFFSVLGLKFLLLILFSSDYQNKLFIPFVEHFLNNFDNPWQYAFKNTGSGLEFPYHPLVLYILSFFSLPIKLLGKENILLKNLFFKLPTLISDITMTFLLIKLYRNKIKEILIYYFCSPVIIYACYMHSQLDLMHAALFMISVYLLMKEKIFWAALVYGLALNTKLYLLLAFPLIFIFLLKNHEKKIPFIFSLISISVYGLLNMPYALSEGFRHLVLNNPKQSLIFNTYYSIGNFKIYIPVISALVIYSRYFLYKKINIDLFLTYIAGIFSVIIILIPPHPAWYIWLFPFISIFFIKNINKNIRFKYFYISLSVSYVVFFVFFFIPEYWDLYFLSSKMNFKIFNEQLKNLLFISLISSLLVIIYLYYKFGIKSNLTYRSFATIIGIGGDSGVGKSTLLEDIKNILGKKLTPIEGDAEHRWERGDANWDSFTHLNPKANELHQQANYLIDLKSGNTVIRRDYDHHSGKFTKARPILSNEIIVLSGLHPFYLPKMRKLIDLKIYLDTDESLRKYWKVKRDKKERGHSVENILKQIEQRKGDAIKYIYPQKQYADVVITYFTENSIDFNDTNNDLEIKVKVLFDASINVYDIISEFDDKMINYLWEYSDDLTTQYIVLSDNIPGSFFDNIYKSVVENADEIATAPKWLDGIRGFVQLIILISLSEKMKVHLNEN